MFGALKNSIIWFYIEFFNVQIEQDTATNTAIFLLLVIVSAAIFLPIYFKRKISNLKNNELITNDDSK